MAQDEQGYGYAGADEGSAHPVSEHERRDRRRGRRRRRGPLAWLGIGIGVLTLGLVAGVVGYAFWLQHTVESNVVHKDLLGADKATVTLSPDGSRQATQDGEVPVLVDKNGKKVTLDGSTTIAAKTPARSKNAGNALNFLIIGSDSRDLSVERGRSDVIVLMHINDARDRVDLVHIPRDTFVPIAGTGYRAKINAAYSLGGAPLLVQTLQPLLDIPLDHVVIVNFESFKAMTDAIGGVDVNVPEASPGYPVGVMHMDGETGLKYVRERYTLSQGDISRGVRQMEFVKAIMLKALSRETLTNPARVAGFIDAATTNLTVDDALKVGEMRDLGFSMRDLRGKDIHFWQGPWRGIAMDPVAGSIVLMADQQMATLSEHLKNDTMDSYVDNVSPKTGFGG